MAWIVNVSKKFKYIKQFKFENVRHIKRSVHAFYIYIYHIIRYGPVASREYKVTSEYKI